MAIYALNLDNSTHNTQSDTIEDVFSIRNGWISTQSTDISLYKQGIFEGIYYDLSIDSCSCDISTSNIDLFSVDKISTNIISYNEDTKFTWSDFTLDEEYLMSDGEVLCGYYASDYDTIDLIRKRILSVANVTIDCSSTEIPNVNYTFELDNASCFVDSTTVDVFSVRNSTIGVSDTCDINVHIKSWDADNVVSSTTSSSDIRFYEFHQIPWLSPVISTITTSELNLNTYTNIFVNPSSVATTSGQLLDEELIDVELFSVYSSKIQVTDTASITTHMGDLIADDVILQTKSNLVYLDAIIIECEDITINTESETPYIPYALSSEVNTTTNPPYLFLSMHKTLELNSYEIGVDSSTGSVDKAHLLELDNVENSCESTDVCVINILEMDDVISTVISDEIVGIDIYNGGVWYSTIEVLQSNIGNDSDNIDEFANIVRGLCIGLRPIRCVSGNIELSIVHNLDISGDFSRVLSEKLYMYNEMPLYIANYN